MVFYDTSNKYDSVVHYVNDLLTLPTTDTTFFTLEQKARAANTAKYKLALMLWKASDAWQFDDNAHADLNIATTTLVAGQRDYRLPTYAVGLERVEVKNSGGSFYRLKPMDESDRDGALTNYGESNGSPVNYWVRGRSLFIDPPCDNGVSVTLDSGLKIYFPREINEFNSGTTTTEIGFDEPGDRCVALMMAEEWAGTHPGYENQLSFIQFQLYGGVKNGKPVPGLLDLVVNQEASNKLKDMKPGLRIVVEDME